MIRFHREGKMTLLFTLLFSCILFFVAKIWMPQVLWLIWITIISLLVIVIQFFRNPIRIKTMNGENLIIAPADGKVVVIESTIENEYFNDERIQVSIFMSPFNVHVNRNPIDGVVLFSKMHKGKYLVAWNPKSSTENERSTIVYKKDENIILMRQIAGFLARRIVNYLHSGDQIIQGNEMGFIKFGSRVDLFLPKNAKINVKINENVKGGETIIANF